MANPHEKLAESLKLLKNLQDSGIHAIQTKDISRTHRQRLIKTGFLQEVMKGWYVASSWHIKEGDSTSWYASYWDFIALYLEKRFKKEWCLSPEQSLLLHASDWTVSKQLIVRSPKANNTVTQLPHNTSLLDVKHHLPAKEDRVIVKGLRLFSIAAALVACSPRFFQQNSVDVQTVLFSVKDPSEILHVLLSGGHTVIAGRIAGAFRHIGRDFFADEIIKTMRQADYDVREHNPFEKKTINPRIREQSPYVNRMQILWQQMRDDVIAHFPKPPKTKLSIAHYLKNVLAVYVTDAYHSLSIEGYHVSPELILRVQNGDWHPHEIEKDRKEADALAVRGYWLAFQAVQVSLKKILEGKNPGEVFSDDFRDWYSAMFSPAVQAGILKQHELAGFRRWPVYIRGSMHVPPNADALLDLMAAFQTLLCEEENAAVRIVLGHFFFVYIHPYMDGNGRMARFLMNSMFAAGGYAWVVVPVERRDEYFSALEMASTQKNILPFTKFLGSLVNVKSRI